MSEETTSGATTEAFVAEGPTVRRWAPSPEFWAGRRVLVTGHTGFVGTWAARWLQHLGAQVSGASLPAQIVSDYSDQITEDAGIASHAVDITDAAALGSVIETCQPEFVLHLAGIEGQARAARDPAQAFAVNAAGTVNLLNALRDLPELKAVLVVTSDCIYRPTERDGGSIEDDPLAGGDAYAASKAACDLAVESFGQSWFEPRGVAVGRARGGALIGGGDYSPESLTLSLIRGAESGKPVVVCDPGLTRPWLHVVDGVAGYLAYLEALVSRPETPRVLNFGPPPGTRPVTLAELAGAALDALGSNQGWLEEPADSRAGLRHAILDTSAAYAVLGIDCALDADQAIAWAADWRRAVAWGADPASVTVAQIQAYPALARDG